MRSTLLQFTAPVLTAVLSLTLSNAAFAKAKSGVPHAGTHHAQARSNTPDSAPNAERAARGKALKSKVARTSKKAAPVGKTAVRKAGPRKTAARHPRGLHQRKLGSGQGKTKITRLPKVGSPKMGSAPHNSVQHFRSHRA